MPTFKIGFTCEHFLVEGIVLNAYRTFESGRKYAKHLKIDLIDVIGVNTIILIGQYYIKKNLKLISIDTCLKINGVNVSARNPNDGGSINFSLHVDAITTIFPIPFFKT